MYYFGRFSCQVYSLDLFARCDCDFCKGFCFVFISLRKVGFIFETGAFSLGFRICLSFVVFVFTLFLAVLLSVSFGFLYDLFGSIFCRACGLFVILFRVSV